MSFQIDFLQSGGIITNYFCTSRCKHCLYNCSSGWPKDYMNPNDLLKYIKTIKSKGCHSVHIGGGEPFLRISELIKVLKICKKERIHIDYIETNSSWYKDENSARSILSEIRKNGVQTLLISISPFHNEHIPLNKIKGVINASNKSDISVFPWIQDFYNELSVFDPDKKHDLNEYIRYFGDGYIRNIPSRYWIRMGGRALKTYSKIFPLQPVEEIVNNSSACNELTDTSHFHVDLYGNYIPGLCSGISIHFDDLGASLNENDYPIIIMLYKKGVAALYNWASEKYDFRPARKYLNKCHLCFEIRKHLTIYSSVLSKELQPVDFYKNQ